MTGPSNIYKSTNGLTWSKCNQVLGSFNGIAFGNGIFVITTSYNAGSVYVSANNGDTWTNQNDMLVYSSAPSKTPFNNTCITYGNGKFVACSYLDVVTSEDGIHWSNPVRLASPYIVSCKFCNNAYIIGYRNGSVSFSYDGISWSTPTQLKDEMGNNTDAYIWDICFMP